MINQQNTSNNVIQELQNKISEKIITSFDMVAQDRSNYFAKNPYQHQKPSIESANLIVNGYAKSNGGISAAANLVPGPLGMLAIAPEIITVMRNQIAMIYDVGVAYDKQQYLNKELLAGVLISSLGTGANRVIVIEASKIITKKLTPSIFKRIVHQLTGNVVKSAGKSIVSKWLPGVGSTAMGLWSAYSTKQVGNKSIQIFEKEIEILDETQSLSESSIEYTDNILPPSDIEVNNITGERLELLKIKTLINLMKVDGSIEPEEKEYLKTIITNANLTSAEIQEIKNLLSAQRIEVDYSLIAKYPDDALGLLIDLIALAKRDGDFHITEKMYIKQVGKLMGFSEVDIAEMMLAY
ncbi:TerB family tellurite resistance protein [Anabaena aphanizomenioides LEGE 00250]|uniref:TerB family tellurite resistance protein n=1 Tax=Sphaerospermopsis aphanizomenoides LEGE 00250 TaxID=2777972 RepID=A0ABR9VJ62_9CYAN|nr:TerB family tellurite resistance protein [Sphaerospermopsis aphanizomenoides]MBE9238548.1 TerB family tellurite resistance protein [Sphaerospermopsis aphanizomenoides LEGE 00250]